MWKKIWKVFVNIITLGVKAYIDKKKAEGDN